MSDAKLEEQERMAYSESMRAKWAQEAKDRAANAEGQADE